MSAELNGTASSSSSSFSTSSSSPSPPSSNVRTTRKSPAKQLREMTDPFTPTVCRRLRQYSLSSPPMPWFGIDIGGTLVKLVYFEPDKLPIANGGVEVLDSEVHSLLTIHRYLMSNTAYGQTGIRDDHLRLNNVHLNNLLGNLHFIRFPSNKMSSFIQMAKDKGLATLSSTVCATGGGAYMWEKVVNEELDLNLFKFDELVSLISGLEFLCEADPEECYYWQDPIKPNCQQVSVRNSPVSYPYLLVNIGSGVSILAVYSEDDFRRITGSSLGGGMFFGLCCLLTGCKTFEEALDLAEKGNNHNVDKLVKDIYGGDYARFQLSGTTVAASFGQMIDEDKRISASKEDLARAALVSITNNISSIARMASQTEKIDRVVFVGNFLRVNPIAMKLLANAMEFWSNGAMRALFCRHEGYFGAVGCLLELMRCSEMRRNEKILAAQKLENSTLRRDPTVESAEGT